MRYTLSFVFSYIDLPFPRAFTQLVADSQFSALGTVLISILGLIHKTTENITEAYDLAPPKELVLPSAVYSNQAQRGRSVKEMSAEDSGASQVKSSNQLEDLGEPVSRNAIHDHETAQRLNAEEPTSLKAATVCSGRSTRSRKSTQQKKSVIDELFKDLT